MHNIIIIFRYTIGGAVKGSATDSRMFFYERSDFFFYYYFRFSMLRCILFSFYCNRTAESLSGTRFKISTYTVTVFFIFFMLRRASGPGKRFATGWLGLTRGDTAGGKKKN